MLAPDIEGGQMFKKNSNYCKKSQVLNFDIEFAFFYHTHHHFQGIMAGSPA
jgi:hypothetical protein